MPILGDFVFVTTGGNFSSTKPFKTDFKTTGRYGKGHLAYLLVELEAFPPKKGPASVELRVNGTVITTLPVMKTLGPHRAFQ
jgi:hypothetical protein